MNKLTKKELLKRFRSEYLSKLSFRQKVYFYLFRFFRKKSVFYRKIDLADIAYIKDHSNIIFKK